ncbi:hypothetical protein Hanom_Chr09g00771041 [Helianthus anomalus]
MYLVNEGDRNARNTISSQIGALQVSLGNLSLKTEMYEYIFKCTDLNVSRTIIIAELSLNLSIFLPLTYILQITNKVVYNFLVSPYFVDHQQSFSNTVSSSLCK